MMINRSVDRSIDTTIHIDCFLHSVVETGRHACRQTDDLQQPPLTLITLSAVSRSNSAARIDRLKEAGFLACDDDDDADDAGLG